jgi:hypothetical protein
MSWTFEAQEPQKEEVLYFEDASADVAPYYTSGRSIESAKTEVEKQLTLMGAIVVDVRPGKWTNDRVSRLGFEIRFTLNGVPGIIRTAGLPIKKRKTDGKLRRVQVQALLNVADWLKSSRQRQRFSLDSVPLAGDLLDRSGGRTLSQAILDSGFKLLEDKS